MKRSWKFSFSLLVIIVFALTTATTVFADNHAGDCVIPESGPWPPCATGGEATDQWNSANMPGGGATAGDCMIPESGPWPPCATGGGAAPMPGSGAAMPGGADSGGMAANAGTNLLGSMQELEMLLDQMSSSLDSIFGGGDSCAEYMGYYNAIGELPVYENLPAEWVDLHNLYVDAGTSALESNKDVALLCENGGGTLSSLNYGVARAGIDASREKIKAGIAVASEMADAPPAPPAPAAPAQPAPAEPAPAGACASRANAEPMPEPEQPPAAEPAPLFTEADARSFGRDSSRVPGADAPLECNVQDFGDDGVSAEVEVCTYLVNDTTAVGVGAFVVSSAEEAEEMKEVLLQAFVEFLDFEPAGADTICSADFLGLGLPGCYRFATNNNMFILIISISDSVGSASQAAQSVNIEMMR